MAILETLPEPLRSLLAGLPCPAFETTTGLDGPPLNQRRIAIVSTAGIHPRHDRPFVGVSTEYRMIPGDVKSDQIVMSHMSVNFDRSGFQIDWNVAFPLDRLRELAAEGVIASVATSHYSFMGAADPAGMEAGAREVAARMKAEGVGGALLVPV
jgi:D-proline reductase (dithiol) PrdB